MKKKPHLRKALWAWLGCLVLLAEAGSAQSQQAPPVIVAEARVAGFVDRVEALGTLRANESVEVTATVSEMVTDIHFQDGQRVRAGDILVEMTSEEEHALIQEGLSTVSEAKKQYDRVRTLAQRGAASEALLDQRRREYETARARLRALESNLKDRLVLAPFSGVVGLRNISVGALIEPGDVITTLDDDSVMKLDFTVPAVHLASLRNGLSIEARSTAFVGRTFEGRVTGIGSRIDPVTRSVTVRAVLANPERVLKPGLLMQVDLLKNPREVLTVPEEALIPSGRSNTVMVVDRTASPAISHRREVTIGARRPGQVEITGGLTAGEFVVVHGTLNVRPGQPVSVMAEQTGDESLAQLLNRQPGGTTP